MDSVGIVQILLDRIRAGDDGARNELFEKTYDRLVRLAAKILSADFPRLANHEAESILHQALPRLIRALEDLGPAAPRDYYLIAAQHMRWVLLDLSRRPTPLSMLSRDGSQEGNLTLDPAALAEWSEFHEQVERLPEKYREVTELLWYHGLTQAEAANLLGVSDRTVKSRWREARLRLGRLFEEESPHENPTD